MATICPLCEDGTLKKTESQVYCSEKKWNSKTKKNDGCDFHIFFDQKKIFGEKIDAKQVKALINGETLISKKGHKMTLDLEKKGFYTKIEFAEKEEDEDL